MKKTQILTENPRRRRFSEEQKTLILNQIAEGATVASVARSYDISQSLIYCWRREAKKIKDAFIRLVPSSSPALQIPVGPSLPAARICLPSGIVIEFASSITLDDIAGLASRLGGRS